MKNVLLTLAGLLLAGVVAALGIAFSGLYNVGADDAHWSVTTRFLEMARNQSVWRRAKAVQPPDLTEPALVLKGAGQYAAMCTACHLAPGMPETQVFRGLYPRPPRLDKERLDARYAFVVIKHGLKMTGMPAWGGDHGDEAVWSLVAFINQLPGMTPQQYRDTVAKAPPDEEMPHADDVRGGPGISPHGGAAAAASAPTPAAHASGH